MSSTTKIVGRLLLVWFTVLPFAELRGVILWREEFQSAVRRLRQTDAGARRTGGCSTGGTEGRYALELYEPGKDVRSETIEVVRKCTCRSRSSGRKRTWPTPSVTGSRCGARCSYSSPESAASSRFSPTG